MTYTLRRFEHDGPYRVFTFECTNPEHLKTEVEVRADLSLVRRHGIPMQELPLLCRELLEQRADDEIAGPLTFPEEKMSAYASRAAITNAADAVKKQWRPRVSSTPEDVGHLDGATRDGGHVGAGPMQESE